MTRDTASDAPDATQAWSVDDTVRDGLDRIAALELSDLMPSARENVPSSGTRSDRRADVAFESATKTTTTTTKKKNDDDDGFAIPSDSDDSDADGDEPRAPPRRRVPVLSDSDSDASDADADDMDDSAREDGDDVPDAAARDDDEPRGEEEKNDDAHVAPDAEDLPRDDPEEARKTRARLAIIRLRDEMFAADPSFKKRSIATLNAEAVAHLKAGDDLRCVAAFAKVFRKTRDNHLTHKDLGICHSNRAASYLNLGLFEEALWDARKAQILAEEKFRRERGDPSSDAPRVYMKAFARVGFAHMGLKEPRLAKIAFENGLKMDNGNVELKRGLEEASDAILRDLLHGRGTETLALPASTHVGGKIGNLPHAAPLHHIHPRDMLPVKLLTPFQAENDYHLKDTYNYMTVQADIRLPKRHFAYLEDVARRTKYAAAVKAAVARLHADARDVRVLNLGCGAGLLAMEALRAGAHHVVATDRWLYHATAAKENLLNNGFSDDQVKVVYKRPTDLAMLRDVPISCNLIVNDIIDDGLLASGIIPAFRHAVNSLCLPDAILLPSSATMYAMPVEMRVDDVCGIDVSAMNQYRWSPTYTSAVAPGENAWIPLAPPVEVWTFDFQNPPEESEQRRVDLAFEREGKFNAVVFWYTLHLIDDITITTAPVGFGPNEGGFNFTNRRGFDDDDDGDDDDDADDARAHTERRPTSMHPSAQYLPGEIKVAEGDVVPLTCAHNTVGVQFRVDDAEYIHVHKNDASFPQYHFAALKDTRRAEAYDAAIARQIAKINERDPRNGAHVLDVGAGSGLLSMMAARAGAESVLACEWHGALATCARRNVAANKMSSQVTVAHADVAKLSRGHKGARHEGYNMVVVDMFDAGLTGEHVMWMLANARKNVVTPEHVVVPAAATMYCMGVEAYTSEVCGFDMSAFNKYRWDKTYETVRIGDVPHRALTKPKKAFEFFFDGSQTRGKGRESVLRMETIASGYMNAIVFWFDLHMDEHETITTAPFGIGKGGALIEEEELDGDVDAIERRREERDAAAKRAMERAIEKHRATMAANPRTVLGAEAVAMEEAAAAAAAAAEKTATGEDAGEARAGDGEEIIPAFEKPNVQAEDSDDDADGVSKKPPKQPEHYWGQAIQYLERGVQVRSKKKVTLLAKREADRVTFNLKEGVGAYVGKPPWKIEWGGGASVESPHYQRVHYCDLLVSDYLMRLRSKRFPPIEKEMKMILAHCGNLFLDPATISEMYHHFACLELVHGEVEFSPGASMEALTKKPLELCGVGRWS
jgi:protein arginine N-methyltransferase 7